MVTATGRRFSLNMLSGVSPKGEFRFMLHDGTVTAPVFKSRAVLRLAVQRLMSSSIRVLICLSFNDNT